jgi:hypothetical protein
MKKLALHINKSYLNDKHDMEIMNKYIKSYPKYEKNSFSLYNVWRVKKKDEIIRSEQEELYELKEIEKRFISILRQKKGNGFNKKYINSLSNLLYQNTKKNYAYKRLKLIESNNQNSFSKNNNFLITRQKIKPLDLINKRLNNQKYIPINYIKANSTKNIFKNIKFSKKNNNYHSYTNIKRKIYFSPDDIQIKEPDEIDNSEETKISFFEVNNTKNKGFYSPKVLKLQKKIKLNLNNNNNENIVNNSERVSEPFRKEFFRNLFNKMKKEKRIFEYKKYSD